MKKTGEELLNGLAARYPQLAGCRADVEAAFCALAACYRQGGKLLVCGNGGSAADADHIVGELMKGFLLQRPVSERTREGLERQDAGTAAYLAAHLQNALPALSLSAHAALCTAFANDVAADMVFAQQVHGYGRAGDVLLGISTSGNAANVANAVRVARAAGLHTIALTGQGGGALGALCHTAICVPARETFAVQELHVPVYHTLCALLEDAFFGE